MIDILTQIFPIAITLLAGAIGYGKLLHNVKSLERDITEIKNENNKLEKEMEDRICALGNGMRRPDGRSVFLPRSEFEEYKTIFQKKIDLMCSTLTQIKSEQSKHGEILASLKTYLDMRTKD
jgi:hypothetical protein